MKKALLALSILTLTGLLVLLHGQTANSLRTQLVGTWRLGSATQRLADGTVRPDPQTGPKGVSYLIYTDTGHMCVVVNNPERSRQASIGKQVFKPFGFVFIAGSEQPCPQASVGWLSAACGQREHPTGDGR
jgi:hypothetical protein